MSSARGVLAPLLLAVAVAVTAWALLVPPFFVPDEPGHFGYAQSLAEGAGRPAENPPPGGQHFSTEARRAHAVTRTHGVLHDPAYKPPWEPSEERAWEERPHGPRDREDVVAVGPQSNHPPLYYAYEVVPYEVASGGDLFDRLFLMRLWSGLLMLVTTAGAWLLIGELTGRNRSLQLAGAACVGLQPMATFISAGVNPDALLFAAVSLALWLAVRLLRRGPTRGGVAALMAVTAVAVLSKAAGLALVPGVAFVLLVVARRYGRRARAAGAVALAGGLAVVAGGLALDRTIGERASLDVGLDELRGFLSYLWQFYLPRLPFQHDYEPLLADTPWFTWGESSWAAFGSLEVQFPGAAYVVLAVLAAGIFIAAGAAVASGSFDIGRAPVVLFALVAASLVAGLHWVEFRSLSDGGPRTFNGRYLLPLMPVAGVAVAAALANLRRRRELGVAVVLGGMAVLQLFSLATVTGRYFA